MTETSRERYREARDRRFAAIKARTLYRRNLVLATIPGIALGLVVAGITHSLLGLVLAAVAGLIGPGVYHWTLLRRASHEAQLEVMNAWAGERGWRYSEEPAIPGDVAFVRDRQKPVARDGFDGPMADLPGSIFNFTYSTYETRTRTVSDGQGGSRTETYQEEVKHRHAVLRLELGDLGVSAISLRPEGLGGGLGEKLRSAFTSDRCVDLESSEFNDRFTLAVADDADELLVRRIFEPAFVVKLVEGRFPLATFQYERPALAFVWDDQYDVEELEEVEHRIADAEPIARAITAARDRLAIELRKATS